MSLLDQYAKLKAEREEQPHTDYFNKLRQDLQDQQAASNATELRAFEQHIDDYLKKGAALRADPNRALTKMETFNFTLQRNSLHAAFIASAEARFRAIVSFYPTIPPSLATEPAPPAVVEAPKLLHDAAKFPTIVKLVSGKGAEYVELACPTCHANAYEKSRQGKSKFYYLSGVGGIINHMRAVHGATVAARALLEEMAASARRLTLEEIVAINAGTEQLKMILGDVGSAEKMEVEGTSQETTAAGVGAARDPDLDPIIRTFENLGRSKHAVPGVGMEQADEGGDAMEME
ncbi:hypothetical protein BU16DRAFT_567533 [Lophium mytilinum]|uniref:Uncharacterized protein n=1 Tax=Lophium mytilinum TaxID=390894 RepID=A0A6A6QBB5_9PEZI|nr:hypothetical protein BU16DRAFT_567533 [Lophium mytilinum]